MTEIIKLETGLEQPDRPRKVILMIYDRECICVERVIHALSYASVVSDGNNSGSYAWIRDEAQRECYKAIYRDTRKGYEQRSEHLRMITPAQRHGRCG
jgi:hypothetical protein